MERRHRRNGGRENIACRHCGASVPVERAPRWRHRAGDDPVCERCGLESDLGADESLAWMFSLYARDESGPQVERWVHRRRR